VLFTHAYPDLRSETGVLRARASWIFGQYAGLISVAENKITIAVQVYENLLVSSLPI